MELIELHNIYKTYHIGDIAVPVLKGGSLKIARGELVALMGASGSGKSTLMNILGCLDRPTSGDDWLDNREVSALSADERAQVRNHTFGFVFQNFNLLPRTSALENVAMPLSYTAGHLSDRLAHQQAKEMLERVGLGDRLDHEPSQLSGGQQQRVAIARIVDFRNIPAGSMLILYSDAPGPFPGGDPTQDYYPGNPNTPSSIPGYGPKTRTLLQIRVKARSGAADATITLPLPARFTPTDPFLVKQSAGVPNAYAVNAQGFATIKLATGVKVQAKVRSLTLNEGFDEYGRLAQLLGTNVPTNPGAKALSFGRPYMDGVTENPNAGDYEIWEIANLQQTLLFAPASSHMTWKTKKQRTRGYGNNFRKHTTSSSKWFLQVRHIRLHRLRWENTTSGHSQMYPHRFSAR